MHLIGMYFLQRVQTGFAPKGAGFNLARVPKGPCTATSDSVSEPPLYPRKDEPAQPKQTVGH
jgi:hypothetical protein